MVRLWAVLEAYTIAICSTDDVLKAVSPIQDLENEKKPATLEQHDNIVEQYKKLIRDQVCIEIYLK